MQVLKRDEISDELKWRLEDIYKSEDLWEKDLKSLSEINSKIQSYQGKLNSKENILAVYKLDDELNFVLGKLYAYAHMRLDQDCTNTKYKEMKAKVEAILSDIYAKEAFVVPEILANPLDFIISLSKDKDFEDYDYQLQKLAKNKEHSLSTKEEVILAKATRFSGLFEEAFSMLDNADIKFDDVTLDSGEKVALSHGVYSYYLQTGSRNERKAVFESMFNAYKQNINLITSLYKGNIEKDWFYASLKNYPSCLDAALSREDVDSNVYKKLIKNINTKQIIPWKISQNK